MWIFFYFVWMLHIFSAVWMCFNFFFTIASDTTWMQALFINFLNLSFFIRDSLSIKIFISIYLKLHKIYEVVSEMKADIDAYKDVKDFDNSFLWIFWRTISELYDKRSTSYYEWIINFFLNACCQIFSISVRNFILLKS